MYQITFPTVRTALGIQGGCRQTPSCSEYAAQAIHNHGAIVGTFSGMKRILSCHPFKS